MLNSIFEKITASKKNLLILLFLFVFSGTLFPQQHFNKKTLEELQKLQNNISIAIAENDSLSMARAYYKLALKYDYLDENDSCDIYYNSALEIAKRLNNKKAEAIISNALATTYSDRGLHDKAINLYNNILDLFFSIKDSSAAAGVMLNLGAEYFDIGQYQEGLEYSLNSLKMKIKIGDSTNIAGFYQQIGSFFDAIGNKDKWKEYTLFANYLAKKNEKYGDFYRRMDILNELGGYYFSKGDLQKAKNYYDTLYTESMKKDYMVGVTISTSNLVPLFKKKNDYSNALVYSKKALELSRKSGKISKIIYNLIETAKIEIVLKKFPSAERNLLEAEKLSKKYNFPSMMISVYKSLSDLNFEKRNFKNAYKFLNQHIALKDSIEGAKTQQKIAELETKYQTEKKDNEIKLLNRDNLIKSERIKLQEKMVVGLILFALLVIALFFLLSTQRKLKYRNRILSLNHKLLQTQMNPHFIFNALIAIQNYVLKNKKFEASDFLSKFATLMRTILNSSRKEFCILKNEIEMLQYYVELQQLRFENSFRFDLDIDEKIDLEETKIPPMLIQPFVENAIEHGLRSITDYEKILSIKYISTKEHLKIIIEDNGIGIDSNKDGDSVKKHKSHAMEITKERLTNITKIYNENIDISIQDLSELGENHGTRVEFLIPQRLTKRKEND